MPINGGRGLRISSYEMGVLILLGPAGSGRRSRPLLFAPPFVSPAPAFPPNEHPQVMGVSHHTIPFWWYPPYSVPFISFHDHH